MLQKLRLQAQSVQFHQHTTLKMRYFTHVIPVLFLYLENLNGNVLKTQPGLPRLYNVLVSISCLLSMCIFRS